MNAATDIDPASAATKRGRKGKGRLTRIDWIAIARQTLAREGIDAVKIDRLARQASVTRGSFYWHFKDRSDLLDILLRDWEVRHHLDIEQDGQLLVGDDFDLERFVSTWLDDRRSPPDLDMAVRNWARRSRAVAASVGRVDAARIHLLERAFRLAGYSGDACAARARLVHSRQIARSLMGYDSPADDRRFLHFHAQLLTHSLAVSGIG